MVGRFDFSDTIKTLSRMADQTNTTLSAPIAPDKRSRAEAREDFDKELASIDKSSLIELKNKLLEVSENPKGNQDDIWSLKNDLENSLIKFIKYIDKLEDLNGIESRKVALKESELKLEARHDWAEKFRLFFFRVLASVLFVCTLFVIGYIEKEYDWATLPLSKYVKPVPSVSSK